jgi:hypothetical protein
MTVQSTNAEPAATSLKTALSIGEVGPQKLRPISLLGIELWQPQQIASPFISDLLLAVLRSSKNDSDTALPLLQVDICGPVCGSPSYAPDHIFEPPFVLLRD